MSDFQIKRSITEKDIPPQGGHKETKWQGILDSMKTLEKEEGIEVKVPYPSVVTQIKQLARKRIPGMTFEIIGRSKADGHHIYIIRK